MRPYVGPIERQTLQNRDFRRVVFTGKHAQLVLMSLRPGEEIGLEVHPAVDQFFRVEAGTARFLLKGRPATDVRAGGAVVVPANTRHNVVNPSKTKPLKLYTLYAPPNHPPGTVQKTRAAAVAAHAHR
mgnify:CR=1 FL=1